MRPLLYLTGTMALFLLVGCSGEDTMYPVSGTVKFSDGTIPHGEVATIRFEPVKANNDEMGKTPAAGQIDAEGKFRLTSKTSNDGARAGDYKVTLTILKTYGKTDSLIPGKYNLATSTPLTATVGPKGQKQFDFVLDRN
ncbi:hypothetical protein [Anatilimnocola floriformis]|uniref:hypothetical protein n=1 Tax=Anatilimnocola floriformis TaxID=2948575 RepID=UPI0020C3F86F|nr:hypothetical protein [Anatilimnocola floriformis]